MSIFKYSVLGALAFFLFFGAHSIHKWSSRQARVCTREMFLDADDVVKKKLEEPCPSKLLGSIFSKPLFFLGKGKQCTAYESADGCYVIKFFKNAFKVKKQKKVQESIEAAFIAWAHAPEETAVVACSTGRSTQSFQEVTLLTKKGKIKHVNLENTPFLVQKKAAPFKQTLMRLIAKGEQAKAKEALSSVFDLLATCRDKGLLDSDGSLIRRDNLGFINGKAVLIDTGKLHLFADKKRQTLYDIKRLKPLGSWLEEACPELLPTYKSECSIYEKFE